MVPLHVKAVAIAAELLIAACAIRDMFWAGTPLPLSPDAELQSKLWAPALASKANPNLVLMLLNVNGACMLALMLSKSVALFTNPEGTFLRRNMLAALGLGDLAIAAFWQRYNLHMSIGASDLHYKAALLLEGSAFLFDAIARKRPIKHGAKHD